VATVATSAEFLVCFRLRQVTVGSVAIVTNEREHWEAVWSLKASDEVSWHQASAGV
jgi:hypothetical protein